jgi:hypothetical protein
VLRSCPALARVPRQRPDAITRFGRFRSWGDYSVLFRYRSPSRPIATGGPPRWDAWGATTASAGRRSSGNLLFGRQHHGIAPGARLAKRGGWIARQQPWWRSQGIARRPKSTAPAAAARGSAALPATVPTAARRQHGGRRNAQSALRRRDAGMTIEEMRAKALECTSLYFPDLRWSQPEFQDALAAFFHYILTGAWPPSDHVFK